MIDGAPEATAAPRTEAGDLRGIGVLCVALAVFAGSATAYISLLSIHYIGDGVRWFHPITESATPPGGGVSHLAYPGLQWIWNRLVILLPHDSNLATAIGRLQALNALVAATGLALFFVLLVRWRMRSSAALLATLGLGASYAFAVHATDMTEVMPSFPLAVVAFLLAFSPWARSSRLLAPAAAAVSLGLAAALYLNAILLAPAVAIGFLNPEFFSNGNHIRWRLRAITINPRLWIFGLVLLACTTGIWAVSLLSHDRVLADPTGQGAYGHLTLAHVLGLVFGLANAEFGLVGFDGGAQFLRGGLREIKIYNLFATGGALLMVAFVVGWTYQAWRSHPERRQRLIAVGLWVVVPLGFAAYWDNTYTKLWLAPIAGWWALVALAVSARPARWRWILALTLLITVLAADLSLHLGPNHFRPDPALTEATALAARTSANDLVIATGYEAVGAEFEALMHKPYLSYIDTAFHHSGDPNGLDSALHARICDVRQRGGTVYVVALLDISRDQWSAFLGNRLHLDYARLQLLRQDSARIHLDIGTEVEQVRVIQGSLGCSYPSRS